jgi:hypothetical protein
MDLKVYYQRLREVEAELTEPHVVLVSLDTADGGRAGVVSEVPRTVAAKMIVEARARAATPEEIATFRKHVEEARRTAEQVRAASRMQVTVLSEADLKTLRSAQRSS